jgi:hypothetical protein
MSTRYVIEADQMRGLSLEIVLDAQPREWRKVRGDKKQIETKDELKERTGVSPDLADMLVVGVEGARRRGFQIDRLATNVSTEKGNSLLQRLATEHDNLLNKRLINA